MEKAEGDEELGAVLELLKKNGEDGVNVFSFGGPSLELKSGKTKMMKKANTQ